MKKTWNWELGLGVLASLAFVYFLIASAGWNGVGMLIAVVTLMALYINA